MQSLNKIRHVKYVFRNKFRMNFYDQKNPFMIKKTPSFSFQKQPLADNFQNSRS